MAATNIDELRKVFYLDVSVIGNRTAKLMRLWDGQNSRTGTCASISRLALSRAKSWTRLRGGKRQVVSRCIPAIRSIERMAFLQ
jgi:hypothetical protein